MKVLLENLLRYEDGKHGQERADIEACRRLGRQQGHWRKRKIAFRPARVLMQDFTGVPAVVDLAAMRDAMTKPRRRPAEDQPDGAGRPGDRPFGHRRRLRQRTRRSRSTSTWNIQRNGERYKLPEVGSGFLRQFPRRAARHRHLPPGQSRISRADGLDEGRGDREGRQDQDRRDRLSGFAASAPTRTPPWSTASPCSAGASAASRPRPACSASRSRCCCPK